MSKENNLHDFLTDLADSIREVEGSTRPINPQEFSDRVKALGTGGGSGGESGVPIKVASLPTPTKQDVGKVYLVDTKVTPEVGQVVGDKLYFDTTKNPMDYSQGTVVGIGEVDGIFCVYTDFFEMQGITNMGHCYAIGVASADMSVFLGMPYVYCDMLTVEQFNANVGASMGLPTITQFGWQTDVVDITSIQDRKITYVSETIDLAKVKGGEYYVGTGGNTFRLNEPVGDKIYFDTTKNPTDYLAFIDQLMLELGNGTNSNFLAMMDYAPVMGLSEDTHIYALFLSDETGGLLGLAYLDTANTLTLGQINEMLAPAFGMSLEKFGWQTDVLDTSAFADYVVTENNLALWDFLAYGNTWYDFEKAHIDEIDKLTDENATLTTANETLTATNETLTSEKANLQSQVSTLTSEKNTLTNEKVNLLNQVESYKSSYMEMLQVKNEYHSKYNQVMNNSFGTDYVYDYSTSIRDYLFANNQSLTNVTLPNNLYKIGEGAFFQCAFLSSINIPDSVTSIGKAAFAGCAGLKSIVIPAGVTSLENNCFDGMNAFRAGYYHTMKLSSVVFAENSQLRTIGENVFRYCLSLKEITLTATTPPTLDNSAFYGCTSVNGSLTAIYVPAGSVEAYKAASGWSAYADKIQAIAE